MAHHMRGDRHPTEGTEDSAGIKESFQSKNTGDWTKGRQKKENHKNREKRSPI